MHVEEVILVINLENVAGYNARHFYYRAVKIIIGK